MPSDAQKKTQLARFVLFMLVPLFPRAVRDEYSAQLEKLCLDGGDWPRQSIATVWGAYRDQIVLAFDSLVLSLQLAGMAYIFHAASMPLALALIFGGTLGTLIMRR